MKSGNNFPGETDALLGSEGPKNGYEALKVPNVIIRRKSLREKEPHDILATFFLMSICMSLNQGCMNSLIALATANQGVSLGPLQTCCLYVTTCFLGSIFEHSVKFSKLKNCCLPKKTNFSFACFFCFKALQVVEKLLTSPFSVQAKQNPLISLSRNESK